MESCKVSTAWNGKLQRLRIYPYSVNIENYSIHKFLYTHKIPGTWSPHVSG